MSSAAPPAWRNRIVRSGDAALSEITANPANWRTHPRVQADALSSVLADVGYVQQVIINARSGRLVDGHLRVELATAHGETSVPAVWVDLSDDEERLILATLDPIGALAETNRDALGALLGDLTERADALGAMLDGLRGDFGPVPTLDELAADHGDPDERSFWPVIRVQVSPETHALYVEVLGRMDGDDEAEKLAAILATCAEATA